MPTAPNPVDQRPQPRHEDPACHRLLVVDDHPAVRAGLRDLLSDQPDFTVTAAVASAEAALSVAARERIDVAIVDYQLGGRNGLWVSRKLKRLPDPPAVLIYSAYADGVLAAAAVVAEADGIVSKSGLGSELCDAIRGAARGDGRLPPVAPWLAEIIRGRLDHEQQAIFGMLLVGIAPAEIADTLGIPAAGLQSRLATMVSRLEAVDSRASGPRKNRDAAGRRTGHDLTGGRTQ